MLPHSPHSLLGYYEKLIVSFHLHLQKTQEKMEMEEIHQMRVSIKRIRALLNLLDHATNHAFDRSLHLALFKNLFGAAGRVRESQVNIMLLENHAYPYLKPYIEDQRQVQLQATKQLKHAIAHFPMAQLDLLNHKLMRELARLPDDWMASKTIAFVFDHFDQVHSILGRGLSDKRLHKVRTALKVIREALGILAILDPNNALMRIRTGLKRLNRKIGDWHDQYVLSRTLERFVYRDHHQGLKKVTDTIAYFEKDNQKTRKRLELSLSKYLSSPLLMPPNIYA